MPEARELRSVIEAAEQAAAAGDYVSAERGLREAVHLQEDWLGSFHPDLAHTLNNLGVVYEMADKPDDAEECYRRAHAIALAAFAPDHPFVATSGKNLRDFCEARGRPVELPAPLPMPTPSEREPLVRSWRPLAIRALSVFVLVLMVLAARSWLASKDAPRAPVRAARQVETTRTPAPKAPTIATSGSSRAREGRAPAASTKVRAIGAARPGTPSIEASPR